MIPLRDSISTRRFPFVNSALIAANIGIFVYMIRLGPEAIDSFVYRWSVIPAAFDPSQSSLLSSLSRTPTLVSSMFLHGSIGHLLGNMLFLWVFGDNVEERLGHVRYILFYLLCGIIAALAQVISGMGSILPMVGASGAIGGVMGAYMISFPNAKILTFFWFIIFIRFFWIPAIVYLGIWFLFQLLQAFGALGDSGGGPQIAFWAHAGGFMAGVFLVTWMRPRRRAVSRSARRSRLSAG